MSSVQVCKSTDCVMFSFFKKRIRPGVASSGANGWHQDARTQWLDMD